MSTKASSPDGSRAVWVLVTPRQRLAVLQSVNLPRPGADRKAAARLRRLLRLDVIRDASALSDGRLDSTYLVKGDIGWATLDKTCATWLQGAVDYAPKPEDKVQQIFPESLDAIVDLIAEFDSVDASDELPDGMPLLCDEIEDWVPAKTEEKPREP